MRYALTCVLIVLACGCGTGSDHDVTLSKGLLSREEMVGPSAGLTASPTNSVPGSIGGLTTAAPSLTLASVPESPAPPRMASTEPAGDRLVIYNAGFNIVVPDIAHSLEAVRTAATSLGGYLQELESSAITVRIPAGRFHEALSAFEKLGEVTQRHVKAADITEEMRDLKIRLENAEQVRVRLLQHLDKSTKMEDTIKLEAELERITQTVELLKGKIQSLTAQAAFSTIRVQFNSPLAQRQMVAAIPFDWVRQLGDGLVTGAARGEPDTSRWRCKVVGIDLPAGYIKYYEKDNQAEAMSADNVLIKIQRQDNYDGGDILFWGKMGRRALVENRSISISREQDVELTTKSKARLIVGAKDMSGKSSGYLLAIASNRRHVYTVEVWGPAEDFTRDLPALEKMVKSMDVD